MNTSLLYLPSFYADLMNGILLFIAAIILYRNYSTIQKIEPYKLVIITLLFSIVVGVHGLSHQGFERSHGYNPLFTSSTTSAEFITAGS